MTILNIAAAALTDTAAQATEETLDFGERVVYALEMTAVGLIAVFAVLTLLFLIVKLVGRIVAGGTAKKEKTAETPAPEPSAAKTETDGGELAAVISAAVAAYLSAEQAGGEEAPGFRVVSFRRSDLQK